jgi:hypothetical protein
VKPDSTGSGLGRLHQLTDGVEDNFELGVVILPQLGETPGQVFMGGDHFPKAGKATGRWEATLNIVR